MEKILFKKIELWLLLLVVLGFVGVLPLFGHVVKVTVKGQDTGDLGKTVMAISDFPSLVQRVLTLDFTDFDVPERFSDRENGFNYYQDLTASTYYVLVSRYDSSGGASFVELFKEGEKEPQHTWIVSPPEKFSYRPRHVFHTAVTSDPSTTRAFHPVLKADGSLTFHFTSSPLYQLDACDQVAWKNVDFAFHHSAEIDESGNFWVPGKLLKMTSIPDRDLDERFIDDHLVKISPQGEVLYSRSITQILLKNNLINRILTYDMYIVDPIHLNDIQPVFSDGPHWKKGDVFLSIAHLNMLMLFRPETDELIWYTQDEVDHQHDIDVINDHQIAVFDNNTFTGINGPMVVGNNEVLIYDFNSKEFSSPWKKWFKDQDVRTASQGLFDFANDGSLFVEETNFGRLLSFSPDGKLQWEYINRSEDGQTSSLNWSRIIDSDLAKAALRSIKQAECL